jgi:hypothetical protein
VGFEEDAGQCRIYLSYPQAYEQILVNESYEEIRDLLNEKA